MSNNEKFEGFKKDLIEENEKKYGEEVRAKYGDETVNTSNAKLANITEEQWLNQETLGKELNEKLKLAVKTKDPSGELAQEVCKLHGQWIMFWSEGMYSKEAHKGLGEMYVNDDRFKSYYDSIEEGAAEFLNDALKIYCK